jgi:hypothetical protein
MNTPGWPGKDIPLNVHCGQVPLAKIGQLLEIGVQLKCRYKGKDGKSHLVHTLNGSALALPRIVAALLENHQVEDGVLIPAALHPYCGFTKID